MLLFALGLALLFLAGTVQRAERLKQARLREEALFALGSIAEGSRASGDHVVGGESWEYADADDQEEMLSGEAPCTADEYVSVLEEAGLSADQSAVRLRLVG